MTVHPTLLKAVYKAALFLKERVEKDGWRWSWSYLREHARCASNMSFKNAEAKEVYEALRKAYPDIADFKDDEQPDLFTPEPTPFGTGPDLQEWVAKYGGYNNIDWEAWDAAVTDYQRRRRAGLARPE